MSWDIYGEPLRRGHCEVHPHVHEEYPCSVCISEKQAWDQAQAAMLAAAPTGDISPDEQSLREAHYQGFVSGEYTGRTGKGNSDDAWAEFISVMRGVQPNPAPDEREIAARALEGAADLLEAYDQVMAARQVRSMAGDHRSRLRAGKGDE